VVGEALGRPSRPPGINDLAAEQGKAILAVLKKAARESGDASLAPVSREEARNKSR
jgi:hypothetical protein